MTKRALGEFEQLVLLAILRVGGMQDIDCWNPFSCTAIYQWGDLILEGFVDQGPASAGCPGEPAIARSWERSADGRTWTVQLHEGITFSDGTPVTAVTVKELLEWWNGNDEIAVFQAEILSLEEYAQDTQDYLKHTTQPEKRIALKHQSDTINMMIRRFQSLFFKQHELELPFEEELE